MIINWTAESARLMWAASEYGTYHHSLVETMRPWLNPDMRFCDAGCGIGALSLAIAPYVREVTAADISPVALEGLRDRRFSNIRIQCGNILELPPEEPYDAIAFCLFGSIDEILKIAKQQCRGPVFAFMKNYSRHRFSVNAFQKFAPQYITARQKLQELGIPCDTQELTLEMGQPLKDLAEARTFFELYSQDEDKSVITDDYLRSRVLETGRSDYPLYIPQARKLGWLRFNAGDIPKLPSDISF